MYTLDDIDEEWPELFLGDEYRDLYQHHYDRMPNNISWASLEAFKADLLELRELPLDDFGVDIEDEDRYDILSLDDLYQEENLLDEAGYDRRMNRYDEDEW
jgi:hypothetical protein